MGLNFLGRDESNMRLLRHCGDRCIFPDIIYYPASLRAAQFSPRLALAEFTIHFLLCGRAKRGR
jgi:hypothetical protein